MLGFVQNPTKKKLSSIINKFSLIVSFSGTYMGLTKSQKKKKKKMSKKRRKKKKNLCDNNKNTINKYKKKNYSQNITDFINLRRSFLLL